ncbi:hypothetical protein, partial [Desulfosarcina cetonica]|uniref:hypothetical protein n=1 Tax=Desulfosarcina cetonica TaxID=90730 RepID=UPI0012EEDB28
MKYANASITMTHDNPQTSSTSSLPIETVLPSLEAALDRHRAAVLVAPPGAGKTTVVPLALL